MCVCVCARARARLCTHLCMCVYALSKSTPCLQQHRPTLMMFCITDMLLPSLPTHRVVHQLKGERSFHIFYQMLRGLKDSTKRTQLHLPPPNKDAPLAFKCLAQSGCWVREGSSPVGLEHEVCITWMYCIDALRRIALKFSKC